MPLPPRRKKKAWAIRISNFEFERRDTFPRLTEMVGGGPFGLQPGQWTDDTAMALALADSMLETGGIDETDLMDRFLAWRRNGAYSCTGDCFDIGNATNAALRRYEATGELVAGSIGEFDAGNGSLMRLSPVAIRYWRDRTRLHEAAARQSRTTHASPACVDACIVWADLVADAIAGIAMPDLLKYDGAGLSPTIAAIVQGSWRGARRSDIRSTGYVAHSLEASLWCIARSHDFESAILMAANLGDDADTTAAITGQLAGAIYGASGIPARWREQVAWSDRITDFAERLLVAGDG